MPSACLAQSLHVFRGMETLPYRVLGLLRRWSLLAEKLLGARLVAAFPLGPSPAPEDRTKPGDEATGHLVTTCVVSELLTLAPGARVPVGLPVGSGAPRAVQWTATASHAREASDPLRVLEQGPDRQRTPGGC